MRFTVYEASTGRIKRYGQCPDEDLESQALDGEAVVEGHFDPEVFWFPGGQATAMPPRPSLLHQFNFSSGAWIVDEDAAWARVRRERDSLLLQSDWVTLRAIESGGSVPAAWLSYRQALRDITQQPDPTSIQWPTRPA